MSTEAPWITVAQIAEAYVGLTVDRVENVIRALGVGDSKFHTRGDGDAREFSPDLVLLIGRELRSRGYAKAKR